MDMQHLPAEGVIDHLAAVEELALPQVDELFLEMGGHLVAENLRQMSQERRLVGRGEEVQRVLIDVDDADFAHAAFDEFGMNVDEGPEIGDAPHAHVVDQCLDRAEILDPEGDRRMFEEAPRKGFAGGEAPDGRLAFAHVLGGNEEPAPVVLTARQNARLHLNVEASATERVVDGEALEAVSPLVELHQFAGMGLEHIAGKDAGQIRLQRIETVGLEDLEGLGVDGQEPDRPRRFLDEFGMGQQMLLQIGDALGAASVEQCLYTAIVFQPERNGREIEDAFGDLVGLFGRISLQGCGKGVGHGQASLGRRGQPLAGPHTTRGRRRWTPPSRLHNAS